MTLGGEGGFDKVSHILFLLFEILFLMILEGELFVTKQHKASKDTFFLIHLVFQSNSGLKINFHLSKIKKCHTREGRGGWKSAKKVYYLNAP